jgi:hypothetical protein
MKFRFVKKHLVASALFIFAVFTVILTTGCESTSTIQTVKKDGVSFVSKSSYAFAGEDQARVLPGINPAELLWTEEIVEIELARRGFKPAPEADADMLVSIETEITGGREKGGF